MVDGLIDWLIDWLLCDCFNRQLPYTDLRESSECLVKALMIRQRYMSISGQSFPSVMTRFLRHASAKQPAAETDVISEVAPANDNNDSSDSGRLFHSFDLWNLEFSFPYLLTRFFAEFIREFFLANSFVWNNNDKSQCLCVHLLLVNSTPLRFATDVNMTSTLKTKTETKKTRPRPFLFCWAYCT